MKCLYTFFICLFFLCFSCNEEDQLEDPVLIITGNYRVELATLDSRIENGWENSTISIEKSTQDSLLMLADKQPENRLTILPEISKMKLLSTDGQDSFSFNRDDSIIVYFSVSDSSVVLKLHPPREWSYSEDCKMEIDQLICSEGGSWVFYLIEKK